MDISTDSSMESTTCLCNWDETRGRNLVVCIDGTSNQFGKKNTNVIELYRLIEKDLENKDKREQLTWYNSGIGTYARPSWRSLKYLKQVFDNAIDLAIAWNFEAIIISAYRWLSEHYRKGDRIYLFGFSRGAYQVRVLSAMIEKVGLIRKGNETQIPFAYELYADPHSGNAEAPASSRLPKKSTVAKPGWRERLTIKGRNKKEERAKDHRAIEKSIEKNTDWWKRLFTAKKKEGNPMVDGVSGNKPEKTMAQYFKETFSRNVKVHFVGAWDTVSSVGIVRDKSLPETTNGMEHVCYFRHALALDERRVKFLPEYVDGGKSKDDRTGHTKEVWFAGTHSDIGGGNVENRTLDRSRPPLRWMVFEAMAAGLHCLPFNRDLRDDERVEVHESLHSVWYILEWLPVRRLSFYSNKPGTHTVIRPHGGASRQIQKGQKIHSSLLLQTKASSQENRPSSKLTNYTPKAKFAKDAIERHPHGSLRKELKKILRFRFADVTWKWWGDPNHQDWNDVLDITFVNAVNNPLFEVDQFNTVQDLVTRFINEPDSAQKQKLLDEMKITALQEEGRLAMAPVISPHIEPLLAKSQDMLQDVVRLVVQIWEDTPDKVLPVERPLYQQIQPLILLLLEKDEDYELGKRLLQVLCGRCMHELRGHGKSVRSVAFSPTGQHVLSGSWDDSFGIWNAVTGEILGRPLEEHPETITSAAFSPDCRRAVFASDDYTICVCDLLVGEIVAGPFKGHTDTVYSVAFSPDGSRIVSGSFDNTIRIWDVSTGEIVRPPLNGHTDNVNSVAFSPDGQHIVSGSDDGTIRIWDALTGEAMGRPLEANTGVVWSVTFSPDGHHVVSGSKDCTIRIWDVMSGEMVGQPLQGHTSTVFSVAFSPDGKRIVSGSADKSIRIWKASTGEMMGKPLQVHEDYVWSVAFSPDGRRVVSGSDDCTIRIWDVDNLQIS